jgi:hypothetical protein
MQFDDTQLERFKADLSRLDDCLQKHGMVRAGQWDYERVSYDRKFQVSEGIYYLRIQGFAVEGDIDSSDAIVQLLSPILGKYYYPHGVEYGEDEYYPGHLVQQCEKLLLDVKKEIEEFAE